jgi:zinc transport system substrate-binding protein
VAELRPLLAAGLLALGGVGAGAAPRVVVDVAPVHSVVARVMTGVGKPELLLPPGASPHGYALRPSEAARLQAAELVVWTGPELTPWLAGPLEAVAPRARRVTMSAAPGVTVLPVREDALFGGHGHPDGEAGHAAGHEGGDGHIWLDPANAAAFADAVAAALAELDPGNGAAYAANAAAFGDEAAALVAEIDAALAPLRGRPFIVFHDAYQYFEVRFAISAAGSVALQEGVEPGAARVRAIRDRMRAGGVACAFAEPQFEPRLLDTLTEGTGVRTGVLDPVGAGLQPGPGLYPRLLRDLAADLADCLGG